MKLTNNVWLPSMLKTFCKFLRVTWPAVVLVALSTAILAFLSLAGNVALYHWKLAVIQYLEGRPWPFLSQWLVNNYGMNEGGLVGTHFCFFWVFCIVFVTATFAPQHRFRRNFLTNFLLVWFVILTFWAFLMACAALPFLVIISVLGDRPCPPEVVLTLNTIFFYALPVLLFLLVVLRAVKALRNRSRHPAGFY